MKPKPKEKRSYCAEDLVRAVDDVKNKLKTFQQAESAYGIPKSVISKRISGRLNKCDVLKTGRHTALTAADEEELVLCIQACASIGYPTDKAELKELVAAFVTANNIETLFKNGVPGDDWYQSFMKRQRNLSLKKAQNLPKVRTDARNPTVVYKFYDTLEEVLPKSASDIEKQFIFNCDESGVVLNPTKVRAIGETGKALHRIYGGSGQDSISVLACVSCSGEYMPPLIIFKGKNFQPSWVSKDALENTTYAATDNGWMEEQVFYNWFSNTFCVYISQLRETLNVENTAFLIFDGHKSHVSIRIICKALENNITLIRLPSHLTDLLQPLDKTVFASLKSSWDKVLVKFGKDRLGKGSMKPSNSEFAELLKTAWQEALTKSNIQTGFKSCGLFPVDRNKFPTDVFDPMLLKKFQNRRVMCGVPTPSKSKLVSPGKFSCSSNSTSTTPNISSTSSVSRSNSEHSIECATLETSNNDQDVLDLCITVRRSPNMVQIKTKQHFVEVFRGALNNKNTRSGTDTTKTKKCARNLNSRYAEVVTNATVLQRLTDDEENKKNKIKAVEDRKKARADKKITTQLEIANNRKRKIQNKKQKNCVAKRKKMEKILSDQGPSEESISCRTRDRVK